MYDIEMQTGNKAELPKRSRYYQGMLDLNYLKRGKKYKDLPDSYIIFLCTFDLFKMGYHKYSFTPTCNEVKSLKLNDGTNRIFICAGGDKDDVSPDLAAFIDYLVGIVSDNPLVQDLDNKVRKAREDKKWRAEYMSLQDMFDDEFERGDLTRLVRLVLKNKDKCKNIDELADLLDETADSIREIIEVAEQFAPDYDVNKITEAIMEKRNNGELHFM